VWDVVKDPIFETFINWSEFTLKMHRRLSWVVCCMVISLSAIAVSFAAEDAGDELIGMVLELIQDKDKDVRAVGLDQIRAEAKGEAATKRFAAELPKLPADAQAALVRALADRGDAAARPAVLSLLESTREESVRVAALEALGALGEPADLQILVKALAANSKNERAAARASLVRLRGDTVPKAMIDAKSVAPVPTRIALIEILTERRALETVPNILVSALNDAPVRSAALTSLSQLAGPEHVTGMLQAVLRTEKGAEREAAEKAVAQVCARVREIDKRADPVLAAITELSPTQQAELLPTLGRVGGPAALEIIEMAIASDNGLRHDNGLRGLCNWPDASVASRLIDLAKSEPHPEHRQMALSALIRVAPLPDKRSADERLELLKTALEMSTRPEDRKLVIKRARAIRTVETLRFVVPFIDQPAYAETACETVVELAHHRELRDAHKPEFHAALDKVLKTSKDPTLIERATRYKKGQTWARPMPTQA
jgi:hypothetical protein